MSLRTLEAYWHAFSSDVHRGREKNCKGKLW
jgi:hypothetical protein